MGAELANYQTNANSCFETYGAFSFAIRGTVEVLTVPEPELVESPLLTLAEPGSL